MSRAASPGRSASLTRSAALWFRTTQTTTSTGWPNGIGLVYADAGGNADDFGLSITQSKVAFGIGMSDYTLESIRAVTLGEWVHVAATRNAETGMLELYVDGVLERSFMHQNLDPLTASAELWIGHSTSSGAPVKYFAGAMDELRLWSVVRSGDEIEAARNASLAGDEPGLVSYYRFDEGSGLTAADSASDGYDAVLGQGVATQAPAWAASDAPLH